jgi:hypothetical protein
MTHKQKEFFLPKSMPRSAFAVWVDEGGQPRFPEESGAVIPEECFVHLDASRCPGEKDYVLVSGDGEMFFARVGKSPGSLHREDVGRMVLLESPLLVLGVVVSGFEWFTIPEN